MTAQLARDAMVPDPLSLAASASAQEAAEALSAGGSRGVRVRRRPADGRDHAEDTRPRSGGPRSRSEDDGRRRRSPSRRTRPSTRRCRSATRSRSSRRTTTNGCPWSRTGGWSACSRGLPSSGVSPRTSRRSRSRAKPPGRGPPRRAASRARRGVPDGRQRQRAGPRRRTSRRVTHRELDLGDARAHRSEHLAQLGGCPRAAERPGARADHGDRLVAKGVRGEWAGGPIERVLERARDGRVVLGCGEEDRVGLANERAEPLDGCRAGGEILVAVVRRDLPQPVPDLDLDPGRRLLAQGAEEGRVVGAATERAADRENAHPFLRLLRNQGEVGLQRDLVAECRLAVSERHVPLHVERGAVDDRSRA